MNTRKYLPLILLGFFVIMSISCGGTGSGGSNEAATVGGSGSTGKLSLSLSYAPAPEYQAVYVTISEIQVHRADAADGQWQTILTLNATYNLLDLINGTTAPLGVADLPTGTYTQMRLIIDDTPDSTTNILGDPHPYVNYIITSADEANELKIPSGFQTGIKLVHSFDVEYGRTVGLILDFDASRSVVKAGKSGKWLLKPTIKVTGTVNNATLTGTVMDESLNPILGAIVSAQVYDADTDEVTIVQSTITSSADGHEGEYLMYLEPGIYIIVVTEDGFSTTYKQITTVYNTDYTEDFTLTTALMGLITIDLTLLPDASGEPAIIEFRQATPEYGMIAVKNVNYSESGTYNVSLPDGTYSIIAAYDDLDSIISDDTLTGQSILIDFTQP